jgi:hypothetical protein
MRLMTTISVLVFAGLAVAEDDAVFRAGAATANITPWLGISLAGNMRDNPARYVHDELHVRALVLDDGDTTLAIALVDSCMVPRELIESAKALAAEATGIPKAHLLVAATHSHSAGCATGVFQSDPDPAYQHLLTRRIADVITLAYHNLAPARIGWGEAQLPDEVFNRRWHMKPGSIGSDPFGNTTDQVKMNPPRGSEDLIEPAGPVDPALAFISVQRPDGTPVALLANYALHYVGGTGPGHVSADYFGIFAARMTELLNTQSASPPFVAMMSNGASGDINNIDFRVPGEAFAPYEKMTSVAHKAAAAVHAALDSIAYVDRVSLNAAEEVIQLGVRLPTEEELVEARGIVEAAEGPEMKSLPEIYARETLLLAEYPEEVPVTIQALRIGDLAIAAIPCEVFVEIGLGIKARSPFGQTVIIELANGYNGYLPTADQHALGGYETWRARSSYLEVDAAEKITATSLRLLELCR